MKWLTSPTQSLEAITALTVRDALRSGSPSLASLSMISAIQTKAILAKLIIGLIDFLNVGKSMDSNQVAQTIDMILSDSEAKNLKPEDFKVCFDNYKKGYYGKAFDRIDGQTIFEAVKAYCYERMDVCEQINLTIHQEEKKGKIDPLEVNIEGQKKVIEILKSNIQSVSEIKSSEKKRMIVKSERDIFIQKCFTEFDDLCDKNPCMDQKGVKITGRFTDYEVSAGNNRPIDVVEYTEIKLKEFDKSKINN